MKKIVIIAVIVIAMGVGAYFLFFRNKDKDPEAEAEVILYNYAIEDAFITNVKDSDRLLKTSVILVVNKKDMNEFLDENLYIIRDTILFILRELTEDEIISTVIQDMMRPEISKALNGALKIDNIVTVYFGDFVMQ